MRVLFVCTANQCRSPMAEALLRAQLPRHGGVTVTSAGLMPGGYSMPVEGLRRMARRGLDLSDHVSRHIDRSMIESAGLIIGMSRRHVRSVVAEDRQARRRCFTLKDFVRRGEVLAAGEDVALPEVTHAFDRDRPVRALLGRSHDDDITDPMGRSAAVWDSVADEIEDYAGRLAAILELVRVGSAV